MTIDKTSGAVQAAMSTPANQSASKTGIGADYEQFLQLLTAQIQNQDPLAPMESTEFITQLAQLSSVEQSVATNEKLSRITGQIASVTAIADIGLIDREVSVETGSVKLDEGVAEISYTLSRTAQTAQVNILDEAGTVIRSIEGPTPAAGEPATLTWDGRDSSGSLVADGYYTAEINAESPAGETVGYRMFSDLRVREVALDDLGTSLVLENGERIQSERVMSVR